MTDAAIPKPKFPATFWTANTIGLFERAAYYSTWHSFMVIYLKESLGMTPRPRHPSSMGRSSGASSAHAHHLGHAGRQVSASSRC
ncbi:MAG: hypothetical protein MZV49_00125 [Rhodopseudomonas palustris]|nr:hypothetical protein [Rhodopseudomonas palustris]